MASGSGTTGTNWVASGFTSVTWIPHGVDYLATDCPGAATCVAEGSVFGEKTSTAISTDSGASWAHRQSVAPFPIFLWLSCWDATHCVGARGAMEITSDGGGSWTAAKAPSTFSSWGIECSPPGSCIAVGSDYPPLTFPRHVPLPQPSAEVLVTHDGGATWTQGSLPPGDWNLDNVTSATPSHCMATGTTAREATSPGAIVESDDGGASWTSAPIPAGVPLLSEIACGDAAHCVAVGSSRTSGVRQSAFAVWTSDGGATWNRSSIAGDDNIVRVACVTATECLAAGQGRRNLVLFETTDGGVTWHAGPGKLPVETYLSYESLGLSCTHQGFCMLVSGTYAATSDDAGSTWKPLT